MDYRFSDQYVAGVALGFALIRIITTKAALKAKIVQSIWLLLFTAKLLFRFDQLL